MLSKLMRKSSKNNAVCIKSKFQNKKEEIFLSLEEKCYKRFNCFKVNKDQF